MLVQNAINTLINSDEFKTLIKDNEIDADGCHELTASIKRNTKPVYWYYEIYMNYNDPKSTEKDIMGYVKIKSDGSGLVLSVDILK